MEMKTLRKRLDNIIQMRADSGTLYSPTNSSRLNGNSSRMSSRKITSPTSPSKTTSSVKQPTESSGKSPTELLNMYFNKIQISNK